MTDYSFMKTGANIKEEIPSFQDVAGLIVVFMEDGLQLADKYAEHAKRPIILQKDLLLGLKTRAYYDNYFWNLPGVLDRAKEAKQILSDVSEDDIIDEIIEQASDGTMSPQLQALESGEIPSLALEEWTKSECECESCKILNGIDELWSNWQPNNYYQSSLKEAIDTIS